MWVNSDHNIWIESATLVFIILHSASDWHLKHFQINPYSYHHHRYHSYTDLEANEEEAEATLYYS